MILLSISLKVSVRQPPTALFPLVTEVLPGTPLLDSIIGEVVFLVPSFGPLGSKVSWTPFSWSGGFREVASLVLSFVVAGVFGIEYHFGGCGLQSFFLMCGPLLAIHWNF